MLASMSLDYFDVLKVKLFRKVRNHLHYQTVLRSAVNIYVNVNKTDVLKENMMAQATVLHRAMHALVTRRLSVQKNSIFIFVQSSQVKTTLPLLTNSGA